MSTRIWDVGFPGVKAAADRRVLRLALFALIETPGRNDPLAHNPVGRVERGCECSRQRARWAVEYLAGKGWVLPDGTVSATLREGSP